MDKQNDSATGDPSVKDDPLLRAIEIQAERQNKEQERLQKYSETPHSKRFPPDYQRNCIKLVGRPDLPLTQAVSILCGFNPDRPHYLRFPGHQEGNKYIEKKIWICYC